MEMPANERKSIAAGENIFYFPCRLAGNRTLDPLIKSQLLCQLSYKPFSGANVKKCWKTENDF